MGPARMVVMLATVAVALGFVAWWLARPVGPRSRAAAVRLVEQANRAIGLLENQSLDTAVPLLERIATDVPSDPFGPRNLAVAGVVGLGGGDAEATALATAAARVERARRIEGDSTAIRWLTGLVALAAGDGAAAAAQFRAIVAESPGDAAGWYGIWRSSRLTGDPTTDRAALEQALSAAPANVWLAVEWLRAVAAAIESESVTAGVPGAAIEARRPAIAPFAPAIEAFARTNVEALLDDAVAAADAADWPLVAGRLRGIANLLAPQSEADRRAVDPHPLEFVLESLDPRLLARFDLDRPPEVPAVAVRFAAIPAPPLAAEDGPPVAVVLDDFDLDGSLDLAVACDAVVRVWARRGETWEPLASAAVPAGTMGLLAIDLDLDFDEARRLAQPVRPVADGGGPASAGGGLPGADVGAPTQPASPRRPCPAADLDLVVFGVGGITCLENRTVAEGRSLRPFGFPSPVATGVTAVAAADLDADGRLDLVVADADGLRVFTSLGSAGFRAAPPIAGVASSAMTALLPVDLDRDVDIDVVVAGADGVGWLENLRHGQLRFIPLPDGPGPAAAVELVDADADAAWDIVAAGASGVTLLPTRRSPTGVLRHDPARVIDATPVERLVACDLDNDGTLDLAALGDEGARLWRGLPGGRFVLDGEHLALPAVATTARPGARGLDVGDLDGDGDLDLVMATGAGIDVLRNDGGNAHHWLAVDLEAQQVKGAGFAPSGRVNAHGLGSLLELRAGATYQPRTVRRRTTHFGLGPHPAADVVRVLWLNGVPQNIIAPPTDVVICEQQVLLGSCPYLYAWNGREHVFVTDLLWGAPLGLQRREQDLMSARSWEHILIGGEQLAPRDGIYGLQVTEELWEAAYFDEVRLTAVDHPADVAVFSNEKVGPAEIAGFGVHTVRQQRRPVAARDGSGRDIFAALAEADGVYPDTARVRRQGLMEPHAIELDPGPLPAVEPRRITLFLTGWTYPTTVGLNLALDRDPALGVPTPPSLAVPDGDGGWRTVVPFMGFPGGKTKTIAVDLTDVLVADDPRLRIETSMDIRWDAAFFAIGEEPAEVRFHDLPLVAAHLHSRGFSRVERDGSDGPERFFYDDVVTAPKWPPMLGRFTRFGDVRDLVAAADDRLVILAAGDEMTLRFETGPPCPPGWRRDFLLSSVGWDKDANLATAEGQSVEPLPFRGMRSYPPAFDDAPPDSATVREIERRFHTRVQGDGFWRSTWRGVNAPATGPGSSSPPPVPAASGPEAPARQ